MSPAGYQPAQRLHQQIKRLTGNGADRSWVTDAACRGMSTDIFFPTGANGEDAPPTPEARATCAICPVAQQCADYAMLKDQGTWAGLNQPQRVKVHKVRLKERRMGAA